MSGREFARKHGLRVESVYRWGREFPEVDNDHDGFTEVVVAPGRPYSSTGLEVVLTNGRVIRVLGDFDANQLRAVVEALES